MAGKRLILMRHGKSDWTGSEPDHERGLTKRGRRQAAEAGAWLADHAVPDLAVVSSARRAQLTWEIAAAALPSPPPARTEGEVYGASAPRLLDVVRSLPDEAAVVALVGHNPGLEDLVELLSGEVVRMTTSALAVLELDHGWAAVAADGTARLRASGRPPA